MTQDLISLKALIAKAIEDEYSKYEENKEEEPSFLVLITYMSELYYGYNNHQFFNLRTLHEIRDRTFINEDITNFILDLTIKLNFTLNPKEIEAVIDMITNAYCSITVGIDSYEQYDVPGILKDNQSFIIDTIMPESIKESVIFSRKAMKILLTNERWILTIAILKLYLNETNLLTVKEK